MEATTETLPPPMTLSQRLLGMFTSPNRVFEALRAHPAFAGALLVFIIGNALCFLPIQSIIKNTSINQMIEQIESNDNIPAERQEEIIDGQRKFMEGPWYTVTSIGGILVVMTMSMFFWGLFVWLLYAFGSGGDITFKHAMAAVTHTGIYFLAAGLLKIPLILAKGSVYVATSLALVSPDPDPRSVIYSFLDSFDIFSIAILAIFASGMARLARISPAKSWTMAIILFVIGLVFRVLGAMMGEMMSHMGGGGH